MALSEAEATALVEQLEEDAATLHAIVHGDADAVVPTEGGGVKSAAKAIADMEAEIDAALDEATGEIGASVVKAEEWAEKPEDEEVEPGKYSALHWAAKAQEIRDSMTNVLELKGEFDASVGSFPADPDIGDYWIVTVDGTIGAVDLFAGDEIVYGPSGWIVQGRNQSANEILTKLKTVDGAGSGLDADLLDGQQGVYYLAAAVYTAADVLAKLLTVDGAGCGLDADLLDGQQGAYYAAAGAVSAALNGKMNDPGSNGLVFRNAANGGSEKRDILGTVSQAGGVPTGAIVQRGSNANGEYVRFADGTQICTISNAVFAYLAASVLTFTWTFPAQFAAGTDYACSFTTNSNTGNRTDVPRGSEIAPESGTKSTSSVILRWRNPGDPWVATSQVTGVSVTAIGRWF